MSIDEPSSFRDVDHSFSFSKEKFSNGDTEAPQEATNEKAFAITNRILNKLTGKDFGNETLNVPDQVSRLINEATNVENLSACYLGWFLSCLTFIYNL